MPESFPKSIITRNAIDLLLEFRNSKWKDIDFHHFVKRLASKIANGKKE